MKKLNLLIGLLILTFVSYSQIHEPVKWSFELKNTGSNSANIVLKASIEMAGIFTEWTFPKTDPFPQKSTSKA